MGTRLCVLVGLLSLGAGAWLAARWWPLPWLVIKGAVPIILILGGAIAVIAGLTPPSVRDLESGSSEKPHAV